MAVAIQETERFVNTYRYAAQGGTALIKKLQGLRKMDTTANPTLFFRRLLAIGASVLVVLLFASSTVAFGITYSVTNLGTLGGTSSSASAINNGGQVVGYAYTPGDATYHGFFETGGKMTDLGTFGGTWSRANSINNQGQVVGSASTGGDSSYHCFLYDGGRMTDLTQAGMTASSGNAINNNGQIVGYARFSGNTDSHAFLFSGGKMTDLGILPGTSFSVAYGINNYGRVVGYASSNGNNPAQRGFSYDAGRMNDLGTLGGSYSAAFAINDSGRIVGYAGTSTSADAATHGFLYDGGRMLDLGTLGGYASAGYSINQNGQIVGYSVTSGNKGNHAFLYERGTMSDLNGLIEPTSGWELTVALHINDRGQIVGYGISPSGRDEAFLLTPIPEPPPTVSCAASLHLECANGAGVGIVHAEVQDTNGNPLQLIWTVDGTAFQTNNIPSGGTTTASNVTFMATFGWGEHVVVASASNGRTDPVTCSTTIEVSDTTQPQITRIAAAPSVLWPPNHRMVPISVMVDAVDNCDPSPVVKIIKVISNEPDIPFAPDWEITGAKSLNLRAERLGKGQGRIYTIVVQCKDMSGNVSTASVDVAVPHN